MRILHMYQADGALQHLSFFEICALEINKMFVYKHAEPVEYDKK